MQHTDTTRRAGSLVAGEVVNDSQTYERIVLTAVEVEGKDVYLLGRLDRSNRPATRRWWADERVTVHSDTAPAERADLATAGAS